MKKILEKEDMINSKTAIFSYIKYREENGSRHKARVLVSSNEKNYFNSILYVYVDIDREESFVILEGNDEFSRDFYSKYTNIHQRFKFINGTLLIQASDRWGNKIEIDITGI